MKTLKVGELSIDTSNETTIVDSGTSVICLAPSVFQQVQSYLYSNIQGLVKKDLLFSSKPFPTLYFTLLSADGKNFRYSVEQEYYTAILNNECTILLYSCPNNNFLGDVFMRKYVTYFKYGYDGFILSIADPRDYFLIKEDELSHIIYYIIGGCIACAILLMTVLVYYFLKKKKIKKQLLLRKLEEQNKQKSKQIYDSEVTDNLSENISIEIQDEK